ncbi:MAG: xanthine dehydrogenase family protein subunit M [Pyrinomonadaceae bacterium]|nr:xanthine dehydrogenase family protein subunit M [Pyrinomonadaceae bacterium]
MKPFKYEKAKDLGTAASTLDSIPSASLLAGGTNIVDLMKEDVARPDILVDINGLEFSKIKKKGNTVSIGALATNKDTANHPLVRKHFPVLTQSILAGASAQIRNMATNGGNLNQRTRCMYFNDPSVTCNKRDPGSGCSAMEGLNRMHSIFGWSNRCVAVFPSDMAVGLAALDAVVNVANKDGESRAIPINDYHRLPGRDPSRDNTLKRGEIVTTIDIPINSWAKNSYYLKVRDRASYDFALVSVAAALDLGGGVIRGSRIAMGGVAPKPWRALIAEKELIGKKPSKELFERAAKMEMERARPLEHNEFKVKMGERAIVRALQKSGNA